MELQLFSFLGGSSIGGQGGGPCATGRRDLEERGISWYKDRSGDGGGSGAGGEIYYSNKENIFAFNGDMITNNDYTTKYYEYGKDGSQNEDKPLIVYQRNKSSKQFIPAKIFAQSGTIRETFTTNQGEFTLKKVTRTLLGGEILPEIAKDKFTSLKIVKATDEVEAAVTGYTNPMTPELPNQGIGSRSSDT